MDASLLLMMIAARAPCGAVPGPARRFAEALELCVAIFSHRRGTRVRVRSAWVRAMAELALVPLNTNK